MAMILLDGNYIAAQIESEIAKVTASIAGRQPHLSVILIGEHPASQIYVSRKTKACERAGISSNTLRFPSTISEKTLLTELQRLNNDPSVDGILVQFPLPAQIDSQRIMTAISPQKDVDGFHPINAGKLLMGDSSGFVPCTPLGIQTLLERYQIPISGKRVVIVGRSNIVGKPLAALLMQKAPKANATVTIVHSQSEHIEAICREADILVAAMGQPKFITATMVKEGAVVVDVGISRLPPEVSGGKSLLIGDVDFLGVAPKCQAITPVPGGVGPMTIAMLLKNTLKSYLQLQCAPNS